MISRFDFKLTPAYCLYNGVAVLNQQGATIKFLVENDKDEILKGRLYRAFVNHISIVTHIKGCPENLRELPRVEFIKGDRAQLRKCISGFYIADEQAADKDDRKNKLNNETDNQREAAAVILLDRIILDARLQKATDIHIERNCVRFRVKGRLKEQLEIQEEKSQELVQRIKLLAGMNVLEKRRSQDGQFVYGNKEPVFIRVSTLCVIGEKEYGEESVVMRLLDTKRIPLSIEELGFNLRQVESIEQLIEIENGLVLVCGPTGSGKSTTVSSMLMEIEKKSGTSKKIISLEDPPEYVIPGVSQVRVDERNPFIETLKHIFRQDPDVIMIGEIRDEESAAAAVRASLTGHLVFATLHTASAGEALLRLENLGADPRLLCSVLRGVICQKLNYFENEVKLYADIAIPVQGLSEKLINGEDEDKLEEAFIHTTNFHDLMSCTVNHLKKNMDDKKALRKKRIKTFIKRGSDNEEIYKHIV